MIKDNTPRLGDRLEEMDQAILDWAKLTRTKLRYRLAQLTMEDRVRLNKSIRHRLRKKSGEIEGVAFSFQRHGIFLEHGVGRGRKVGSEKAKRYRKPWLSTVLPAEMEALANLLVEQYADIAVEQIKLNIPGVIKTEISN